MKSIKTNKGITLIGLIITIIVLLILTIVTISSIENDGILVYAKSSENAWNQAQVNEQSTLNSYLNYFDKEVCKGEHTFSSETGLCSSCGYACEHATWTTSTNQNSNNYYCGLCTECGYECHHKNGGSEVDYVENSGIEGSHIVQWLCKDCELVYYDYPENHDYQINVPYLKCVCGAEGAFNG